MKWILLDAFLVICLFLALLLEAFWGIIVLFFLGFLSKSKFSGVFNLVPWTWKALLVYVRDLPLNRTDNVKHLFWNKKNLLLKKDNVIKNMVFIHYDWIYFWFYTTFCPFLPFVSYPCSTNIAQFDLWLSRLIRAFRRGT